MAEKKELKIDELLKKVELSDEDEDKISKIAFVFTVSVALVGIITMLATFP
jgi:hypothetical protein